MLGVLPEHRRSGLGRRLKLAQRERALAAGMDLVEWTFDPLQTANAHLNFSRLGVVSDEYWRNVYGESSSALHRGTPTDRLIVQWNIREPHVERRVSEANRLVVRTAEVAAAPVITRTGSAGPWLEIEAVDLSCEAPRVWLDVPGRFSDLQQQAPHLALEWRLRTREAFEAYFARGYRVVDFALARQGERGRYLLVGGQFSQGRT
jgi:predicted GNAT superfamily acetyltransferase